MKIEINKINIDYRDEGAGIPVIFIHAFPLNQSMWDEQLAGLKNHCRVITIDLRGFGKSDAPDGPHSMDQMASDVRGLMAALDIDRAVLAGLSMGGYVSLAFYRNYPEAIRGLVLADTRATADAREARERRLKSAEKAEREGARAIADDMTPLLLGRSTVESRTSIVERVRAMIEANSPHAIAAAQRGMAERLDSTAILAGIDFPTLIIVGAEDKLTPVAEAEALRARIGGSRLRVIESAGHLSNMEQPAQFNSIMIEFIETMKAEQGADDRRGTQSDG
ncbi:MAG TPA: alpha/beta fold hydrolase [Blastocatellia bacterium]|jgi:pimeloyl-ACP methyl ester carboxylesterase